MSIDLANPETRRDITARREWGCPRPDKTHYLTEAHAQQQLTWNSHKPTHDPTATVYHCPAADGSGDAAGSDTTKARCQQSRSTRF